MNDLVVVKVLSCSLLSLIDKVMENVIQDRFGKFCFNTVAEKSPV